MKNKTFTSPADKKKLEGFQLSFQFSNFSVDLIGSISFVDGENVADVDEEFFSLEFVDSSFDVLFHFIYLFLFTLLL